MQLGNIIINLSEFLGGFWEWLLELFSTEFTLGGITITMWQIFAGLLALGILAYLTIMIIRLFT